MDKVAILDVIRTGFVLAPVHSVRTDMDKFSGIHYHWATLQPDSVIEPNPNPKTVNFFITRDYPLVRVLGIWYLMLTPDYIRGWVDKNTKKEFEKEARISLQILLSHKYKYSTDPDPDMHLTFSSVQKEIDNPELIAVAKDFLDWSRDAFGEEIEV